MISQNNVIHISYFRKDNLFLFSIVPLLQYLINNIYAAIKPMISGALLLS